MNPTTSSKFRQKGILVRSSTIDYLGKIKHIDLRDIDPERVYRGFKRRITDIPHRVAWNRNTEIAKQNREYLSKLTGIHSGERCVIIGNGPSLNKMDLTPLKNEITFGLNRIYLLFPRLSFKPTYYVSVAEFLIPQFYEEIGQLEMPKFINWQFRRLFRQSENCHYIRLHYRPLFSTDLLKGVWGGGSVTYTTLQIAYSMGFQEVILIGIDHSFKESGTSNKPITAQAEDENHFTPDYFGKGVVWQLPDYKQNEWAYSMAKEAFEKEGRQVIDATVGGKLQIFPKTNFNSLF